MLNILNICFDILSVLKCDPSMCCRWAWQMPVWLGGAELVPKLESTWAIYTAAQSSQNCCFNSDKGILILCRTIYLPQRSFSSPAHCKHITPRKALSWSLFSLVVLTRPGLRPIPGYSGEGRNPDVSAYTSSPESKFSADQFVYKIKLWEFRVQSKVVAEPSKAENFLNRFVSTCYLFQS